MIDQNSNVEVRALCDSCGASVRADTYKECSGICMRCFMEENDGFKPDGLVALEVRGLTTFKEAWSDFKKEAYREDFSSLAYTQKQVLSRYADLIFAEVDAFLQTGSGQFCESPEARGGLVELESFQSQRVNRFISRLRDFYAALQEET